MIGKKFWEILCFSSCGDSTKQSAVTVSNTHLMFCLTRAFQFDTQMITTKQSTLTLGPKNFLLIFISGQTGELLPDNLRVILNKNQTGSDTPCLGI